jgi:Xaa-Pro aminopeptidase
MARTYTAGAADRRSRELHRQLEDLFTFAAHILRPGITWGQGCQAVAERADHSGVGEFFQRMVGGGMIHYIGHGIGLELNEPPLVDRTTGIESLPERFLLLEMHLLQEGPSP